MHTRTHSFAVFLLVGFVGAFVTAFAFIAVIQLTLPPNDEAYGQGIFRTLGDPFVTAIATPVALVAGALATPLLYFCLRRRRLAVALPIVFGSVLVAVAVNLRQIDAAKQMWAIELRVRQLPVLARDLDEEFGMVLVGGPTTPWHRRGRIGDRRDDC